MKSQEGSGQFPAWVRVQAVDRLDVEIQNILGGVEGSIQVRGQNYSIREKNQGTAAVHGRSSWKGLPLRWLGMVLLGRIPCPPARVWSEAQWGRGGEIHVQDRNVEWVMTVKQEAGGAWPEKCVWKDPTSSVGKVEFTFFDPEDSTRSPRRWEVRSTEGEVLARWRERKIQKTAASGSIN